MNESESNAYVVRDDRNGDDGELNIGQLMRERHPDATVLIGFSTYKGSVTAASE